MAKHVAREVYVRCYKWAQLLQNHYLQNGAGGEREGMEQESLTTAALANLLFPNNLILRLWEPSEQVKGHFFQPQSIEKKELMINQRCVLFKVI